MSRPFLYTLLSQLLLAQFYHFHPLCDRAKRHATETKLPVQRMRPGVAIVGSACKAHDRAPHDLGGDSRQRSWRGGSKGACGREWHTDVGRIIPPVGTWANRWQRAVHCMQHRTCIPRCVRSFPWEAVTVLACMPASGSESMAGGCGPEAVAQGPSIQVCVQALLDGAAQRLQAGIRRHAI